MLGISVLIIYTALMLGATVIFTKQSKDASGFHVADRRIGSVIGAMSIAATWIWAPALFLSAEQAYVNGIPGIFWFLVPNVLCLILFIPFAKCMRAKYPEGITLTGFMDKTYRSPKVKAAYSFQLGALAMLSTAVQLLAGGKLLAQITGIPFPLMTIILAAIAYSYARFSGIKSSVITDVVQLGIILCGCAVIVPWLISKASGLGKVMAGFGAITGNCSSLVSENGLAVFLSFGLPTAVGLISGPFGDQCFWQRTFSIQEKSIGKSFLGGSLLFAIVPLAMSIVGFTAAGSGFSVQDTSMVNMEFIMSLLPGWVIVPFLMMVLSGLLSTVDSNLCAAASMTTDWKHAEKWQGAENIRLSRCVMIGLLIISILIANIPGLTITHLFLFYGTLRASTLLPTMLTLLGKKLSADGVFWGIVSSICLGLPIFAVGNILGLPVWKTAGSLITVLMSGFVAVCISKKGVQRQ